MSIDFTKPVQTRDGRKVRIVCIDGPTEVDGKKYPIVGFFEDGEISVFPKVWGLDGSYRYEAGDVNDLVNVPPPKKKVKVEVRLYFDADDIWTVSRAEGTEDKWPIRPAIASQIIEMEYQP